jgi:hypothetical protein
MEGLGAPICYFSFVFIIGVWESGTGGISRILEGLERYNMGIGRTSASGI